MFGHSAPNRAPRFSLPSLDIHGTKFAVNNNVTKSRTSLPSVAFNTIKQHISKTLPCRRASLATPELNSAKLANGDLRRKKIHSDDLTTMHDTIHEDQGFDSAVSSRATSSEDVFSRNFIGDSIRVGTRSGKFIERHHSVDDDSNEQKLTKMMQDPRRRLSETAVIEKEKSKYQMAGFEDVLVGKLSKPGATSSGSQNSLKVIYAIKQDPSYGNLEFMDTDKGNKGSESDAVGLDKETNNEEKHSNDEESAIIECEIVTVNPVQKIHTAESPTDLQNNLLNMNRCVTNDPTVIVIDEISKTDDNLENLTSKSQIYETNTTHP